MSFRVTVGYSDTGFIDLPLSFRAINSLRNTVILEVQRVNLQQQSQSLKMDEIGFVAVTVDDLF